MLLVGLFSTAERLLLSTVQYRSGPSAVPLLGLTIGLLDGVKLYAKSVSSTGSRSVSVVHLAISLAFVAILAGRLNLAYLHAGVDSYLLLAVVLILLAHAILADLLYALLSRSKYAYLATVRVLVGALLADVLLNYSTILHVLVLLSGTIETRTPSSSTSLATPTSAHLACTVLSLLLLSSKLPYDYAESESELIAGTSIDASSVLFSLGYLIEMVLFLSLLALLSSTYTSLASASVATVVLALLAYLPRILSSRFLITYLLDYLILATTATATYPTVLLPGI